MPRSRDWPIAVRQIDISRPLSAITGVGEYPRVRVFVARGDTLLGAVDIWSNGADSVSVTRLQDAVAESLAHALIREQIRQTLAPSVATATTLSPTTVSVIVPTRDRGEDLRRCLASLSTQRTRHTVEVVVVDNHPGSGVVRQVTHAFPAVRVVEERRPGLSYARNTGIAHASGEIIVCTDDDVIAPDDWIEKLMAPFGRPEVMAVTGNVLPLELETEAQCRFEAYGGLGKGFAPLEANGSWFRNRITAVPTWHLGATANAAFRATAFRDPAIGLLDEALGAGTPTGCSEDTYLFYRILKVGHSIVYEPSAFVWHRHRRTMDSLRHQIHAYSKGHVAYHLTTWLRDGDRRALVRLGYSLPMTYARRILQRIRRRSDYPLSLVLLEVRGSLAGPYALWRSRRRVRRLGPSSLTHAHGAGQTGEVRSSAQEPDHAVSLEGPVSQGPSA